MPITSRWGYKEKLVDCPHNYEPMAIGSNRNGTLIYSDRLETCMYCDHLHLYAI